MVKSRTEYKNTVGKFNYERDKHRSVKLLNAKLKNAKVYWKLLKSSVVQPKPKDTSIVDFEDSKAVNNHEDPFFQPDEDIIYFKERYRDTDDV